MAKKILYVITQGEWGGAQRYIYDLATSAKASGYEAVVAFGHDSANNNALGGKLSDQGIATVTLKHLVRPISPINDLAAIFELAKLYRRLKPDVIHLNSSKAGIIGSLASLLSRHMPHAISHKLIYTAHGWVFNEPLNPLVKKIYFGLEKLTAAFKSKIICVAESDKKLAIEKNITTENKLITIHNGMDIDEGNLLANATAKKELSLPENTIIIGTIANFYDTKGLKYFIEAINLLKTSQTGLPLLAVIIGDGELRPQLENLIANYNLKNHFWLLGQKDNAAQYLKAFDIYICSSVKEGFPYSILEAMAAGRPIISTDVGGIPEIIQDQTNGLLIGPHDASALASQIKLLMNDASLMTRLGQQAQIDVEQKFSLSQMLEKTFNQYP